ncbi:MAG: family 20 glycosylhydrolase [candidate division KSB1 bacterium]|nr:family 20 glycosylhydrolase [candidate division KSB1 bacterium]
MRLSCCVMIASLTLGSVEMRAATDTGLIPEPQQTTILAGKLDPRQWGQVVLGPGTSAEDQAAVEELLSLVREKAGANVSVIQQPGAVPSPGQIWLGDWNRSPEVRDLLAHYGLRAPEGKGSEAYVLLLLPDRAVLAGPSPAARYYACQTLAQWLEIGRGQCVGVIDWPAYELRGVTDDISRGQVSTAGNFKTIIRRLAQLKMNVYMPYLEDMFTFRSYPQIGQGRGAWTPELARELQDYAERYHVQIIPIFQTLGHYENILIQPEFIHLAEFPGAASLNVSDEATYGFLEQVLSEILPAFRSPYFHIGADESWDVGKGASRERAQKLGVGKVHVEHYKRVHEIVKRHGKTVMMYADIVLQHPEILEELPRDIVLFDWHYDPQLSYPSVETFHRAGFRFVVSPGIHNWAMIFPNHTAAMANILHLSLRGLEGGALGCLTSNWGDYGGANLRELNWFGYAWAAACSWNPQAAKAETFGPHFVRWFYGAESPELVAAIHLLSEASELSHYPDLWRHPFYRIAPGQESRFLQKKFDLPQVERTTLALLEKAQSSVRRNLDHLDYLAHAARVFGWVGRRAALSLRVEELRRGLCSGERDGLLEQLATSCDSLADRIRDLEREYVNLWLRTNLDANLSYLLELFERQESYLRAAGQSLRAGKVPQEAELRSRFVTARGQRTGAQTVFLRKRFVVEKPIAKAVLQAIGNDQLRVFLNGQFVGEVFARSSLSIRVEKQRVRTWDVSGQLCQGTNVLAFEAVSFDPNEPASGNLYLWIQFTDGSRATVLTDESWRASVQSEPGWVAPGFRDEKWKSAVDAGVRWRICEPDFEHNLPSRIEWWE